MANLESRKWQKATLADVDKAIAASAGTGGGTGGGTVKSAALNNFKKSNTRTIQAMLSRGASPLSKARGRIVVIGDSYMAGNCAGNTSDMTNGRANCASSQLAAMLTARGIRARADWTVGDAFVADQQGGAATLITPYDPRVTFGGNAAILGDFGSIGGNMIQMGAATDTMKFFPGPSGASALQFDRVEIIVAASPTNGGTFDVVNYTGTTGATVGSTQTVTSNDIEGVKKVVLTVPATSTAVLIKGKTGGTFIQAVGVRMSTQQGIEIINCSASGQTLEALAAPQVLGDTQTWNNMGACNVLMDTSALNVTIIDGWFNDVGNVSVAQTQANLDTMIKFYKTKGDVIFLGYGPLMPVAMDDATYQTWQSAMYQTCLANDIPYIDPPAAMPTAQQANDWGMYGDGGWHYGSDGHAIIARLMLAGLESAF